MRRLETSEVMSAAEEPSPVLCTSASCTPVLLKGGIWAKEASVGGSFFASSCTIWSVNINETVEGKATHLGPLRVEVIVPDDSDVEAVGETVLQRTGTALLESKGECALECEVDELVLRGGRCTARYQHPPVLRHHLLDSLLLDPHAVAVEEHIVDPSRILKLRRAHANLYRAIRLRAKTRLVEVAHRGVEPRTCGDDDAGVRGVEDEVTTCEEDLARSGYGGRTHRWWWRQ